MSTFTPSKEEVLAMMDRFIEVNKKAEEERDWSPLADFYAEDAVYRYTMGAAGMREARGRDEVRRLVMQRDMEGFDGWTFPYEWVVVDGDRIITKWWNRAPATWDDGSPCQIVGNSNIRVNQELEIVEMHDNFDLAALLAMIQRLNREKKLRMHIPGAVETEAV